MSKWNPRSHITDLIIQGLERGVGPWTRPWKVINPGNFGGLTNIINGSVPFNPFTGSGGGRSYNGMNTWMLAITSQCHGWTDPRFCTFKQLAKKGWKVRPDQTRKAGGPGPSDVYFWNIIEKEVEDEKTGQIRKFKFMNPRIYRVWNFEQIEGPEAWASPEVPEAPEPVEETEEPDRVYSLAWAVTEAWDTEVPCSHGGDRAFYRPGSDIIRMPKYAQFHSEADYLGTKFHEQVHSTGHESREERDFSGRFGNEAYAVEELVAEIGAAGLMAATGVSPTGEIREDHVAYVGSWIKVLKGNNKAIFTANSQANKAVSRILEHAEEAGVLPKPSDNAKPKSKGKKKTRKSAQ